MQQHRYNHGVRFHVLLVVCFIILVFQPLPHLFAHITGFQIVLLATATAIAPLFFKQKAFSSTEPRA